MPTQMPRNGTPRAIAARIAPVSPVCVQTLRGGEVAHAGKNDALGRLDQRQIAVGHDRLGAEMLERLEHRGQVAGFVVDDGDRHAFGLRG